MTISADRSGLTCARCAKPIPRSPRSLPQGEATCHPCRREAKAEAEAKRRQAAALRKEQRARRLSQQRTCGQCRRPFDPVTATQRFCSSGCWYAKARAKGYRISRTRPHTKTTAQRGYGAGHQRERARWAKEVEAGRAICWRCRRPIQPGSPWDLGHDDHDRTQYRGPEHRACNRGAGARKVNQQRRTRRRQPPATTVTTQVIW